MTVSGLGAALQGIEHNKRRFEAQAETIARAGTSGEPLDDLPGAFAGLQVARRGMEASFAVVRSADEMLGTLLDVLA